MLGNSFGGWVIAAGLLALVAIVIYSNFAKMKSGAIEPGMTTEVAALLLYGLGAYVVVGNLVIAVVVGGAMAVLLHFKKPLHDLAGAIGEYDMRAIMQFVLLSLVILPVLPNRGFRAVRSLESVPNLADGRAHRRDQPFRLYRLQNSWPSRRRVARRHSRWAHLQHSHDRELCASHGGKRQSRRFGRVHHHDCLLRCPRSRSGRGGGRGPSVVCLARPAPHGDAGRGPPHRHAQCISCGIRATRRCPSKKILRN